MELANERVKIRVAEGGHHIPEQTITRRYYAGIFNFIYLYKDLADYWILINNSRTTPDIIAETRQDGSLAVAVPAKWAQFNKLADHDTHRTRK